MSVKKRLKEFASAEKLSISAFEKSINVSNGYVNSISKSIGIDKMNEILEKYPKLNIEWLLTGEGSMHKSEETKASKNLIPLYDDVATIGGSELVAEPEAILGTNLQIDAGDWFNDATAAIRHYGDSMVEYQSGCILAIRELQDKTEIIWGRNYVVETAERRITKRLSDLDADHINCHSTNNDTYPNGEMIHGPIKIRKDEIRRISRVIGAINYEESTGVVNVL